MGHGLRCANKSPASAECLRAVLIRARKQARREYRSFQMAVVPNKDVEALQFFEDHWDQWQTNEVALGIPPAVAAQVKDDAIDARAKLTAQALAKNAAKSATLDWNGAMSSLRSAGATAIAAIRAKADASADPNAVYSLAQIPPPAAATPLPPPATPTTFSSEIQPTGALLIKWRMPSAQPGNTFYQVARKLAGETAFDIIGGSGNKTFLDESLPFGTDRVEYQVTAIRGSVAGTPSNSFVVQFGVGGEGATALKIAA